MKWKTVRIGDVCQIISGTTPSTKARAYWDGDLNWVTPGEIEENSKYIFSTQKKITEQAVKETNLRLLPIGTVLLSSRAPIGKVAIAATEMYCNQGFKNLICSNEVHNEFLFWFLKGKKDFLNFLGRGATFKEISKDIVAAIELPLPPLVEQKRIAAILDKADAIRRKRQQSLTLIDDLVKSQFIEMFGDWNEMERWPCTRIAEIADVTVGVVIKPAQYYTEEANGIRAFRSLNVGEMRVRDDDWVYFTPDGHKANDKSELRAGDVLVVRSGYPGTSCVVPNKYHGSNAIDVIIARPDKSAINPLYLCAFTNFTHGKHQVQAKTGGAAQQHFNVGAYKDMIVSLPPLPLQNQFAAFVEQTDKSKFAMQRQLSEIEILSSALKQKFFA